MKRLLSGMAAVSWTLQIPIIWMELDAAVSIRFSISLAVALTVISTVGYTVTGERL